MTDIKHEESSGNVFEDLGLPNAEEENERAKLSATIMRICRKNHLSSDMISKITGISEDDAKNIQEGLYHEVSLAKLNYIIECFV